MTELPPRVVVGVDGSEQSKLALRWGAHLASARGTKLEAIATWEFPMGYGWAAVPVAWNPEHDTEKFLTQTVDEVFGDKRPVDMRLSVHESNPAKALIDPSEDALMVVVGSRGHGGFAGLLLGSVSASVAEHAKCPVVVVHGDKLPPEATS